MNSTAMTVYIVLSLVIMALQFITVVWIQNRQNAALMDLAERQLVSEQNQTEVTKNLGEIIQNDYDFRSKDSININRKLDTLLGRGKS